jgi:diaminohydroxyphosphoribosylaminopyrimidine deaminase/5-amino-6-(5-phosphoribosylamino)uracil reductase
MRGFLSKDEMWMRRALGLARKGEGTTRPNPPVGAVVVQRGRLVGQGWHRRAGGPHAEVVALRAAGTRAKGATLYVTLEPCCTCGRTGPCTDAILSAGIARVVAAVTDPNPRHRGRGIRLLRKAGVHVDTGTCMVSANELLAPFRKWVRSRRPFLTLKLACSLDGRIADAGGRSRWISGARARHWVRRLRRRVDAVIVGAGTARADDPSLLAFDGNEPRGHRVVVSANGRLAPSLRLLSGGNADRTIVAVSKLCPPRRRRALATGGASVWVLPSSSAGLVSMPALLRRLGRAGFLHVLCEGGGELASSLIGARLVDRYRFILTGRLLGGGAVCAVGGKGWPLDRAPSLRMVALERLGPDALVTAEPTGKNR